MRTLVVVLLSGSRTRYDVDMYFNICNFCFEHCKQGAYVQVYWIMGMIHVSSSLAVYNYDGSQADLQTAETAFSLTQTKVLAFFLRLPPRPHGLLAVLQTEAADPSKVSLVFFLTLHSCV